VYYQTYAQHLQWNYFDHPPMLALLIRLTTLNLYFNHEVFIRLGAVICSAAGTWIIFNIGDKIAGSRTGWIAAILYTTSFYSSTIAGIFILPDSPQVVFWLGSIYLMLCILDADISRWRRLIFFCLLGICTGLCIMSKLHGIFLLVGFGGFVLFNRKEILRSPDPWIAIIIAGIVTSPIYFWNLGNHFITYRYHHSRIGFFGNKPDFDAFLQQIFGSVFYCNPVNFLLYVFTLYAVWKRKSKLKAAESLLLWLSLPLIGVLLLTSLFNETLPHWSGPAYFSMMLLAGAWLAKKDAYLQRKYLLAAAWLYGIVVTGAVLAIHFSPFVLHKDRPERLGQNDFTLDMYGWKSFAADFDSLYKNDVRAGIMHENPAIISDYWFPAAHLDHYVAMPEHLNLLVFGPLNHVHQFAWLNESRPRLQAKSDAYFIYPTNEYGPPAKDLRNVFSQVDDSLLLPQWRNGHIVRNFVVYRLHGFTGQDKDYLNPNIR
jgi:Dolichyl-phosphate-mannose-protein mannosyltransferase